MANKKLNLQTEDQSPVFLGCFFDNIYEKVKQPNADKVKITLDSKIKPILFETELDKISIGDLEFDFRPARFSGLGISPDVTQGREILEQITTV